MSIGALIAFLFFGGQYFISKGKWLGEGDIYVGIAMAMIFGWKLLLIAMSLSYFLGAFVSIIMLLSKKASGKTQVPFAPFMVLGTFLTIFFGERIMAWYLAFLTF